VRAVAEALAPGLHKLSLRDLADEYLIAIEVGGRSRRTIDCYRTHVDQFAAVTGRGGQRGTLEDLTPAIARRWLLADDGPAGQGVRRRANLTELSRER
jgi:hypothetical protein